MGVWDIVAIFEEEAGVRGRNVLLGSCLALGNRMFTYHGLEAGVAARETVVVETPPAYFKPLGQQIKRKFSVGYSVLGRTIQQFAQLCNGVGGGIHDDELGCSVVIFFLLLFVSSHFSSPSLLRASGTLNLSISIPIT